MSKFLRSIHNIINIYGTQYSSGLRIRPHYIGTEIRIKNKIVLDPDPVSEAQYATYCNYYKSSRIIVYQYLLRDLKV